MKDLSTLPNREGFKFRGIRKDGGKYMNCRLKSLPGTGMYIVAAGGYVYEDVTPKLAGWADHPRRASVPSSYGEQDEAFRKMKLRGLTYRPP